MTRPETTPSEGSKFGVRPSVDGAHALFECDGEFDLTTSGLLRVPVRALLDAPETREIVFDLRRVWFLDSSGLEVIVYAFKEMRSRGGRIEVRLSKNTQPGTMLMLSRLTGLFNVTWHEKPKDDPP